MNVLFDMIKNLGPVKVASIGAVMMGILGFFIYLMSHTATPEMGLLFSQIDPSEGGKIMEKLDTMGIQGEVRGDSIYAPVDRIARLRMEMAQEGLPSGGSVGYEIFDKSDVLGTSGSLIDINHVRALEGEIAKSIRTIAGVAAARVHLVMPKRELFSRDKADPSASVVLKMRGNSRLSPSQVHAVQHLVASAVANLPVDKIAIIDDKGALLAKNRDRGEGGENSASHQDSRALYEAKTSKTIENLIEQTVGVGKVRAEVMVDMDFGRLTINSEEFNPDGQVVRSTTNSEEDGNSSNGGQSDGVTAQQAIPNAPTPANSGHSTKNKRKEETIKYEISRTTKTEVKESGTLKKLSVAVIVDGIYTKGSDGAETYAPRPKAELDQITNLVKTAIGFNKDRGDTVEVINMKFTQPDASLTKEGLDHDAWWMPQGGMGRIIEMLVLAIAGFLIMMLVVRPIVFKMIEKTGSVHAEGEAAQGLLAAEKTEGGANREAQAALPGNVAQNASNAASKGAPLLTSSEGQNSEMDAMIDVNQVDGRVKASSLKKIGEIVDNHPEETVAIMRNWMYSK